VSVLQRSELEDSPLADLHAIASELGIEGYRALRRDDLVAGILKAQGGDGADADTHQAAGTSGADEARGKVEAEAPSAASAEEPEAAKADGREPSVDDEGAETESATGTLDILPNGSGFMRVSTAGQSSGDVYVSPAQIRRCELRAGDEVSGPVRSPRRSERHPSLVRVTTVNGRDAEPPEERPEFENLTPVHPAQRLAAPAVLDDVPFGKGSRVAIAGAPGAGATRLLREMARELAGGGYAFLAVVLVAARPEEVTEWEREEGIAVAGGPFDRSLDAQTQSADLAVERAKRAVERGGDAVVIIDSLEALPPGPARRLFGAARNTEEAGSLTVIAAVGGAAEPLRQASTRITLDAAASEPTVLAPRSGTQRADLLA